MMQLRPLRVRHERARRSFCNPERAAIVRDEAESRKALLRPTRWSAFPRRIIFQAGKRQK
jgi:hypothetical protein